MKEEERKNSKNTKWSTKRIVVSVICILIVVALFATTFLSMIYSVFA